MPDPREEKPDLTSHPLVTKRQGDSDTPPRSVALVGYFGSSKKEYSIRLYPSLDFQSYYEIPQDAIISTHPVDAKDELSPTVVYVKAGTPVEAVQTATHPIESFLQGGITGVYLQGAIAGVQQSGAPQVVATMYAVCANHIEALGATPVAHAAAYWTHPQTPFISLGPACPGRTHPCMVLYYPTCPIYVGTVGPACPGRSHPCVIPCCPVPVPGSVGGACGGQTQAC